MISKKIFYLILLLIPVNLGKHFILDYSYISGGLVDYLVPAVYVSDVLCFLLIIAWFFEDRNKKPEDKFSFKLAYLRKLSKNRIVQMLVLFIFCVFLSAALSPVLLVSVSYALRILLYALVCLYVYTNVDSKKDLPVIVTIFSISVLFTSVLGVLQFFFQHSVFNNYLILGEQPYNIYTKGLTHEYLFGRKIIPPYSLFRHPNIFGGFLSVALLFLVNAVKERLYKNKALIFLSLFFGLVALFLTLSVFSYISFILGLFFLFFTKLRKYMIVVFAEVLIVSASLPFFYRVPQLGAEPSFYRRADLLINSYDSIKQNYLFGTGIGAGSVKFKTLFYWSRDMLFVQPVHNVFILIFEECGVFALILFLGMIFYSLNVYKPFTSVLLFQLAFLGCFDHYVFTIHQTLLLFYVVLGLHLLRVENNPKI